MTDATEPSDAGREPVALRQTVDDDVRRRVATLVRTARHAALACLEPETGAPLASRIGLATDIAGAPVFLTSALTAHTPALLADSRCALLVGDPGKGDPLAHPRVTLSGRAERVLPGAEREAVRWRYLARHPKAALYADFGDFAFWRVRIERASFNGGFGKAYHLAAADLVRPEDDLAAAFAGLQADVCGHMNADHAGAVALYATALCSAPAGAWRLAGIDPDGLDLVAGDRGERLWFETPLADPAAIRPTLVALAGRARSVAAAKGERPQA
ncbi:MAG: HugZ family protein [Alphaproteobacteria bacterium]|nr:HugZ family protein [Alphaproteobacteria bacterium]